MHELEIVFISYKYKEVWYPKDRQNIKAKEKRIDLEDGFFTVLLNSL